MMKKACIIGHFGFGESLLNGQTIKTKNVTKELEDHLGVDNITKIDTHGGIRAFIRLPFQLAKALRTHENVLIFPAHNGLRVIAPLLHFENLLFRRKIHYVVIGGWLPEFLANRNRLRRLLCEFTAIYVETEGMEKALKRVGFNNIYIMPNFKEITPLKEEDLIYRLDKPIHVCTFSRVMKEKGIEEAINAVEKYNKLAGEIAISLDIYGQIDEGYKEQFDKIVKGFPPYIQYKGEVSSDRSIEVVKYYQALLFPTYYEGEGFAGTLIDALAAGVPVIASNWRYNSEIVKDGKTGTIYHSSLFDALTKMATELEKWNQMKPYCLVEARKYTPDKAIGCLLGNLE